MSRNLKWFSVLTTLVMLGVLLGGALVTKTDSGMGCGRSFPLCKGKLIPLQDITPELLIEFSHRLVSGSAAILVAVLAIWAWRAIGHVRETKLLSILSISFLLIQALIGGAAVLWSQSDFVLALHFGISLISFAAVLLLTLLIFEVDKKFDTNKLVIDNRMKFHIIGLTVYSYVVVYTGALVRHTESSLVCADFPLCTNGEFALPANLYQWIQMGHRAAAIIIFLWIGYVAVLAVRHYKHQKVLYMGWIIAFILVTLQAVSGASVIFTRANLFVALLHAIFISLLFGLLCYFMLLLSRNRKVIVKQRIQSEDDKLVDPNKIVTH
ncbi:heme A synthase [Lederbergia sp. NSJ-179]|uniref:COX15/CtaA family protein n=1 Tax=Lederbergia sp. NSJ-179 TaxID=2931402 RepID=UPI001FD2F2EA|nr:heme A synthase [Lederbergia sp. NSJ-179]MCJ7843264.1 heme A synthase [Lederbergia sp. NSJ-179]